MKITHAIAALAAATMLSGAAVASDDQSNRNKNHNDPAASASTSTKGKAETNRRRGRASIETRGQARGTDRASSMSDGAVYSSTDRNGSTAEADGYSEAEARNQEQRRPRRPRRDD